MKDLFTVLTNEENYSSASKEFSKNVLQIYDVSSGMLQKGKISNFSDGMIMGVDVKHQLKNMRNVLESILFEYYKNRFSAIYLVSEQNVEFVELLDKLCKKERIPLYVPFKYANVVEYASIVIDMAISGGDVFDMFEYAIMQYKKERICAKISFICKEFKIPSEQEQCKDLDKVDDNVDVFFSKNLCLNYYTKMTDVNTCKFVMFDDDKTLKRKLEMLEKLEISNIFMDYNDAIRYQII